MYLELTDGIGASGRASAPFDFASTSQAPVAVTLDEHTCAPGHRASAPALGSGRKRDGAGRAVKSPSDIGNPEEKTSGFRSYTMDKIFNSSMDSLTRCMQRVLPTCSHKYAGVLPNMLFPLSCGCVNLEFCFCELTFDTSGARLRVLVNITLNDSKAGSASSTPRVLDIFNTNDCGEFDSHMASQGLLMT